jgi:hypothetical protein
MSRASVCNTVLYVDVGCLQQFECCLVWLTSMQRNGGLQVECACELPNCREQFTVSDIVQM